MKLLDLGFTTLLLLVFTSIFVVNQCDANIAAMSVDLGSEFMKIGLVKPGVPMETVLNKESRRKTPTIVAFRNGERFFGDVAAQMSVKFPANSITHPIDLIGKEFENPIVAKYQRDFPHLNLTAHPERNTVVFNIDQKSYDIETILAMLLWNAREQTQAFAGQPVRDVVITIPAYFNQTERAGVAVATKIAGLRLLSLMSEGSAAALNYGVFRRMDITEKPQNLLIYDVGATKTAVTLVEYQLEKKEPQLKVLGVGYDRAIGGRDITEKLRVHLVSEFKKKHKTKGDILDNPRAMAKLWKESDRVKQVLSANTEIFAQVESLFEDQDFKVKVTRDIIEQFVKEVQPALTQPLDDTLKSVEFTPEQVETIVLMGAGTRIPSIQQIVKDYFGGRELARFLNTDEAIALGAVYKAAQLSKGFRVKSFEVHDLNSTSEVETDQQTLNSTAEAPSVVETNQTQYLLSAKQIEESERVLNRFENAERARRDLEAASNALESLVYDTAVKLEEEWLKRKDYVEDFQAIQKEVSELKVWIEEEATGADVLTLRKKRDKLSGMIKAVFLKEKKKKDEARKLEKEKLKKRLAKRKQKIKQTRREFIQRITVIKTSQLVTSIDNSTLTEQEKHAEL